jgi:hypothetical protein
MPLLRSPASVLPALALGGLLALALASPLTAAPLPDREIRASRDRVLEDPGLQTELPGFEDLGRANGTASSRTSRREGDWRLPDRRSPAALASVAHLFQWVLLALGAVALVMLLVWLFQQLVGDRWTRATPRGVAASDDPGAEEEAPGAPAEGDLETLVRRGDYGAAIHLLLLRAVERLSGRGRRIAAGHTSREVLSASSDLPPPAHGALGELVAAVERYLFGGRDPGPADFERCRDAYGTLERALAETPAGDAS